MCRLGAGRIALFYMAEPVDHCLRRGHAQRMRARDRYKLQQRRRDVCGRDERGNSGFDATMKQSVHQRAWPTRMSTRWTRVDGFDDG